MPTLRPSRTPVLCKAKLGFFKYFGKIKEIKLEMSEKRVSFRSLLPDWNSHVDAYLGKGRCEVCKQGGTECQKTPNSEFPMNETVGEGQCPSRCNSTGFFRPYVL